MKLTPIFLTAFVVGAGLLHADPQVVKAEEQGQVQDKKNLVQIIEDYVVVNKGWERGSFDIEADPDIGEGAFSVGKKNRPIMIGGDGNSFLIKVEPKTGKIIGIFAYQ